MNSRRVEKSARRRGRPARVGASAALGRDRLLDAAIELFAQEGFEGASVRSIAARANVSFALIRSSYGSKEGLRAAAENKAFEHLLGLAEPSTDASSRMEVVARVETVLPQLGRLRNELALIRRCILERRPIAMDFVAGLIEASGRHMESLRRKYPNETWVWHPVRLASQRLGLLMITPYVSEILGVDILSKSEFERVNLGELRIIELLEAALTAEKRDLSDPSHARSRPPRSVAKAARRERA